MCGIAGICGRLNDDAAERVQTMSRALAHRGPDGAGLWQSPSRTAVLGHRRLAIIDLTDDAHQPMSTSDGRFTISYNGEIYNYRELRRDVEKSGRILRSRSDTEVLLTLWARDGVASLEKIHGMYAFAVWDEDRSRLTLVRDPFGIKPLYYKVLEKGIVFASELRALRSAGFARGVDSRAAQAFLQFGSVPAPLTIYEDVRALAPGTFVEFDVPTGASSPSRYWDYGSVLDNAPAQPMRWDEARECVRQTLLQCAREHLESDVPVGAFLSGGTDSTAVVSLMRQVGYDDLRSFSIGFDVGDFDETSYALVAADRYGTDHRRHVVSARDFEQERDNIFAAMDEPTVDGVNVYFVSKYAAEAGLKVVTSGLGGDEFFQGYPYFKKIPRLLTLARGPLRAPARIAAGMLASAGDGRAARVREFLDGEPSLGRAYAACRKLRTTDEAAGLMENGHFSRCDCALATETPPEEADPSTELGKRITRLEARGYMANTLLRDSDVFSMAHGLELRLPLVYDRLAECLAAVPERFLRANGHAKTLLVDAVGDLPAEIVNRRKMGFTFPLATWLRAAPAHRFQGRSWNRRAVEELQTKFRAGRAPLAQYWSTVVLDHFLTEAGE